MIKKVAKSLAHQFVHEGKDIRADMAKYARLNNMNPHQIDYFTSEVNTSIITDIQNGVARGEHDPHFTFPTIKTAEIIGMLRPAARLESPTLPPKIVMRAVARPSSDCDAEEEHSLWDLREMVRAKKRKLTGLEIRLNEMMRKLRTKVAHEIVMGVPREVFEALPAQDVIQEMNLSKCASINREFELDTNHEIYKIANAIEFLRHAISEAQEEYDGACRQYREKRD